MYNFSEEAKERIENGKVVRAYLKVLATDTEEEFIIDESNYLKEFEFTDERYVENEGFIGQTVAKSVSGSFNNIEQEFNIQDREFELYIGVELSNDTMEYQKYGTFIVQKPEDDKVNDSSTFESLDYMIKFNSLYKDNNKYPCTVKDIFRNVVESEGLKIKENYFLNQDIVIYANPFEEGVTKRDVLKAIGQIAFSWVRIDEDNNVAIDFEKNAAIVKEITPNEYFTFNKKPKKYGPLNTIVFKLSDVEGENVTIKDQDSINEHGATEISIINNPFTNTEEKRIQFIEAGRALFGLQYDCIEMDSIGLIYLNCNDKIRIEDLEGNEFESYIFNHIIKYNGTVLDSIKTNALTNNETKYQYVSPIYNSMRRTEIIVDKVNQQINSVIEDVSDQNKKISQVTQKIGEIDSKISDIADITTMQETSFAKLEFLKINESEPIYIKIRPISKNISYLYPHEGLYPSDDLYMPDRILKFTNTTTKEIIEYTLPGDLLINLEDGAYDEFILDYENQQCCINKRVEYNADGTVYTLPKETVNEYEYPLIQLSDGDYTITIPGYSEAYLQIRLMAQNIYTTQFAIKAEVKSEIKQTVDSIDLSVDKKLSNYSTTTQMNSAINLKADSITSSVSQTYATKTQLNTAKSEIKQTTDSITSTVSSKVGNDEIISKINQTPEQVQINANKISLKRQRN